MKRITPGAVLFLTLGLLFLSSGLQAADFGFLVKGEFDIEGADETDQKGSIIFMPWISLPFDRAELYISAGLNTSLSDENYVAPELFRLEFSFWRSDRFSFRIGRFNWQDPSQFIMKGRFDGIDFRFNPGKIRLGVNALYTGFLFKDTANISVSPSDQKNRGASFDWADFQNTYFAPGRLVTSLYGEFPGFPRGRGLLYAGLMAQFDLSDPVEAYHTQYLLLRHTLAVKAFDLDLAGAAELTNTEADGIKPAFAFSMEAGWRLPTAITDRLSFGAAWASGEGDATAAFFPVTREAMSFVLKPVFSGIMSIQAKYNIRVLPSLSAELGGLYFIRTDSKTFSHNEYLQNDSYPLGLELDTGFLWVPFSDLALSLNGGIFLPGPAWADDAPVLWRITLGAVFSF